MKNRKQFYFLGLFLITLFSGVIYTSIQQLLRLSVDETLVQISQDVLGSLNQGADPSMLSVSTQDMAASLAPFVIIYDNKEKALGSTVVLDKKTPVPPKEVFERTKERNELRHTWEPKKGVRNASIVVKYKDGFLLVGKSLKDTEYKLRSIARIIGIGWILAVAGVTVAFVMTKPKTEVALVEEKIAPKKTTKKLSRSKK